MGFLAIFILLLLNHNIGKKLTNVKAIVVDAREKHTAQLK